MNKGILALLGSGEFTTQVLEIDKFLLFRLKNPRIAILPTAAGKERDYYRWIDIGVKYFRELGVEAVGIELLNRKDNKNHEIVKDLNNYNLFYFSGGDPGYLLDTIKDSPAWDVIYKKYVDGAILVGSSAGAMVLGGKVFARIYEYLATGVLKPWEDGIGVVDFGVVPHFDKLKEDLSKEQYLKIVGSIPKDIKVIGIDEDTGYILYGGEWLTIGKGKVHIPAF